MHEFVNQIVSVPYGSELLISLFGPPPPFFLDVDLSQHIIQSQIFLFGHIVVGVPVGTVGLCVSALRQTCMVSSNSFQCIDI